jgi:Domain of unknown function (DUF5134)
MAGPPWLAGTFAALMIATAAYCAGRLVVSRLRRRATELDADALHAVMGAAMAGMLAPQLNVLPGAVWAAVFGTGAAWFGWHAVRTRGPAVSGGTRCRFPVPHLIECVAMLYMLLPAHASRPLGGGGGMAMGGMGASPGSAGSFPALAVVLALFMLGYIVWTTDRLATLTRARTTTADPATSRDPRPGAIVPSGALPSHADSALATQATSVNQRGQPASTLVLAPKLAALGKIAMSITMGYMLVLML